MTKIIATSIAALLIASMLLSSTTYAISSTTTTPIKHLVVIFQENVSYDHYFGTYPKAANLAGEPQFKPRDDTPSGNGLTEALLNHNTNTANPFRLDRTVTQLVTCDQDHNYKDEQAAYDGGLLDMFTQKTGIGQVNKDGTITCPSGSVTTNGNLTMGYYDGNSVTALWNYAQNFAMSDNSYSSTFGPSTPGMINLVAGQTHGAIAVGGSTSSIANGSDIGDIDGAYDDCSAHGTQLNMTGKNVGDLLNSKGITWGWFEGGFKPTVPYNSTTHTPAVCGSSHVNIAGATVADYSAHHEPFEYYKSTANPHHLPPTSVAMIGKTDQANHQYDLVDFWNAVNHGNMPAVSYLKAAKYQDGHAAYSDPLDEQTFIVNTINQLQKTDEWKNTAVIILYDDSDGWYDHAMPPIVNQSGDPATDVLCGHTKPGAYSDRCGYGPRQPLLVISPYAKENFIDHQITDQSSVLKFIEDNWNLGTIGDQSFDSIAGSLKNMFDFDDSHHHDNDGKLFLDPTTGEIMHK